MDFVKEWLKRLWNEHSGALVGAGFGLLAAVLMLTINFWRTLLLLLLIGGGALIGYWIHKDGTEGIWLRIAALFTRKRK